MNDHDEHKAGGLEVYLFLLCAAFAAIAGTGIVGQL